MTGSSKSLLEVGDRFRFRGLHGGTYDNDDNGDYEIVIEILNFTVTGQVEVRITQPGRQSRTNYEMVPYDRVLALVNDRIWDRTK